MSLVTFAHLPSPSMRVPEAYAGFVLSAFIGVVGADSLRFQFVDDHRFGLRLSRDGRSRHFSLSQADNVDRVQESDDIPGGIQFEPFLGKIGVVGALVVIILKKLTHHQEIEGKGILAMVIVVVIGITIFMTAPVDQRAVDGAHEKMDGQ